MTQTVLRSLGELEQVRHLFADAGPAQTMALVPVAPQSTSAADIEQLAEAAGRALGELADLVAADQESRRKAEDGLARYRALREQAERLEQVAAEMRASAEQAAELGQGALDLAHRDRAGRVAATAGRLANEAAVRARTLAREADEIAAREDIGRLLAEEEQRIKERQLQEHLARVDALTRQAKFDEARGLLGRLDSAYPNSPAVASSAETLRRHEQAVKTRMAESALREARRCHRREPGRAARMIETLDLDGVAEELVRHIYGCWLQACRRIGLVAAIHYSPAFGKGAVLVPVEDGDWEVVSAIGLARWHAGRRFSPRALRGARALA